ncbi:MAG TPA: hypothetical protein VII01_04500 [Solirubrobacteraceae bacterium]|jgi:hypothetical protein
MSVADPPLNSDVGVSAAQLTADELCAALNLCFAWHGAEPEWSPQGGYTGRVILSPPAVAEVAAEHERVENLQTRIIDPANESYDARSQRTPEAPHDDQLRQEGHQPDSGIASVDGSPDSRPSHSARRRAQDEARTRTCW